MVILAAALVAAVVSKPGLALARSLVRDYDERSGCRPYDETNDLLFATFDDNTPNETKDEIRTGEASDLGARPVGR
jgi:hypothetical protein